MTELPAGHPLSLRGIGMMPHTPYSSLDDWYDDLLKWAMAYARLPTPGPKGLNDARDVLQNAGEWLAHWRLPLPDWFLAEGEPATVSDAVRRMRRLAEEFRPEQAELSCAECPTCGKPAPIDEFNTLRCAACSDFQGKFAELWIDLMTQGRLSNDDSGDETLCELRHLIRKNFGTFDVTGINMLRDWLVADHGMTREQVFVTSRTRLVELLKNKSPKQPAEPSPNVVPTTPVEDSEEPEAAGESGPAHSAGFLSGASLADALGGAPSRRAAFERKLGRERRNLPDDSWHQQTDCRPNSPWYFYSADSPAILNLAKEYQRPKPA